MPKRGIEKVFITHHHSDHISREKLTEILQNYAKEGKELEIYAPLCVFEELSVDFTLIRPNSRIKLNQGYVEVLENNCWKAKGCVAYLIVLDECLFL